MLVLILILPRLFLSVHFKTPAAATTGGVPAFFSQSPLYGLQSVYQDGKISNMFSDLCYTGLSFSQKLLGITCFPLANLSSKPKSCGLQETRYSIWRLPPIRFTFEGITEHYSSCCQCCPSVKKNPMSCLRVLLGLAKAFLVVTCLFGC